MKTEQTPVENYSYLSHLFLELRGRGLSLGSADFEILYQWKTTGVPADVIADVMLDLAEECQTLGKPYPTSLSSVARRVQAYLKTSSEF